MNTFEFDEIIELTLEHTKSAYSSKLAYDKVVNSILIPTKDPKVLGSVFLVRLIYDIMWFVVLFLSGNKLKSTGFRKKLVEYREQMLKTKGLLKRWWEDISVPEIMNTFDNLSGEEWLDIKRLILKNFYIPKRPEAFNHYFFTSGSKSKIIDVIISHTTKMDFGSVQKLFRNETDLVVAEWLEIINNYETLKDNSKDYLETLLAINFPFYVTPMVQDFLRFNNSNDNPKNMEEIKENRAKKIVEKTIEVYDLGPTKAHFNTELKNDEAIVVDQLEELKILNKIVNTPGKNIVNPYYTHLLSYSKNAFMNFKESPTNCVRTTAQRQQVARNNTSVAHLRPTLPYDNIDVQGLIFSAEELSYGAKLEGIEYPQLLELFIKGELNKKNYYLNFSPELKQYLDGDIVSTNYNDIIQGICSQLYNQYKQLKNDLLIKWSKSNKNLAALTKLSLKVQVPEECFQNTLMKFSSIDIKYLQDYFPPRIENKKILPNVINKPKYVEWTIPKEKSKKIINEKINEDFLDYTCQHWLTWGNVVKAKNKFLSDSQVNSNVPKEELLSYQTWQKKILDFTKTFAQMTDAGFFICKSCGSILNQRKYFASGSYVDGMFVTTYFPLVEKLRELNINQTMPQLVRFLDKRFEELCFLLQIFNFVGADNNFRVRKIKEIFTWLSVFTASMNKPKFQIFKDQLVGEKIELFRLQDSLLHNPENSYSTITLILVVSLCLLVTEINLDQIQRLPDLLPLGISDFKKKAPILFKDIEIKFGNVYQKYQQNLPFAYLLYYISGMLVRTNLWNNQDFYFNFIYKKRGRKRKNKVEKPITIDFEKHKEALETMVNIWDCICSSTEWLEADIGLEVSEFCKNIALKAKHNYYTIKTLGDNFFKEKVQKTDKTNILSSQEFKLPFPGYLLPIESSQQMEHITLFKIPSYKKFGLGYEVKIDFPSVKCDIDYNPLWKPCQIKLKLKSKITIWENQLKHNTKKKKENPIAFSHFKQIKETEIPTATVLKLFEKDVNLYRINHDQYGKSINKSIEIEANKVHKVRHEVLGDVIYYTNNKLRIQIFYNPVSLQLVGFQNNKNTEPIIHKARLEIIQSSNSLIDCIGIPIQYLDWIMPQDYHSVYQVCKERILNMIQILKKIRTYCFSIFVSKRSVEDKELGSIKSALSGSCQIKDITIPLSPILSSDYSWINKFSPGEPLSSLMKHCIQLQQSKSLILSTFDNIFQKYNSSSSIGKLKSIFHIILKKASLVDVSELSFYPINPLPYISSQVQVSFMGTTNNETKEEEINNINYEEKQEQQALDDQMEEIDLLSEELQENRDERENFDQLE